MRIERRTIIIVAIVFSIFFVAFSYGALRFTSRPSFCSSCHEIKPSVVTWEESSHMEVKCLQCHAQPGVVGYLMRKVAGLREVWVHLTEDEIEMEADVGNLICQQCHDDIVEREETRDFNFPHDFHLAYKPECTQCHANVAHGDEVIFGDQEWSHFTSLGSVCSDCHSSQQQGSQDGCALCHKGR